MIFDNKKYDDDLINIIFLVPKKPDDKKIPL
jgi:hypothetical protein